MTWDKLTCIVSIMVLAGNVNAKFDPIAFTFAASSSSVFTQYNGQTTVTYPTTVTRHMKTNYVSNGVFTTPVDGIFTCQVHSVAESTLFLDITHNDVIVASIYGHIKGGIAAGGNAVVLLLSQGDKVQVKTRANQTVSIISHSFFALANTFTCSQVGSKSSSTNKTSIPAFSVHSNRSQMVRGGETVMYNVKLVDTVNAFDVHSSQYTVSSAGLYIFHFFGKLRAYINTVILHLQRDDNVTIKAQAASISYLVGGTDRMFTSFSGVQIISDEDANSLDSHPVVAFSVGLTNNLTVKAKNNVIFDKVFRNDGNAFSMTSGEFVTPVSGAYEFSYHLKAKLPKEEILIYFLQNSRMVGALTSFSHLQTSAGNGVVLNLIGGDVVRLQSQQNTTFYGDPSEIYCIFSGYLLYSVSPGEPVVGK